MRRAVVGATILVALASGLAHAQHKIPPIPETAHAPVVLPSGLKYIDIKVGTGVPAAKGRMVRIAFIGWVTKSQLMFDFRDPPNPLAFHLGQPDPNVVKGIDEGVVGMRVGSDVGCRPPCTWMTPKVTDGSAGDTGFFPATGVVPGCALEAGGCLGSGGSAQAWPNGSAQASAASDNPRAFARSGSDMVVPRSIRATTQRHAAMQP